jgi:tetratricopeptide (TPR) repeat protein
MTSHQPPSIQSLVERGIAASRRGAWEEAIQSFDEALRSASLLTHAQRAITLHQRGLAKARLRQLDDAVEDFSQALAFNEQFGLAYIDRGVARAQRGEFRRSLADLNKGLELAPHQPCALVARGMVQFELDAVDKALEDLTSAQLLAPGDADIYFQRGKVQLVRANYPAAIADFEAAVRLKPTDARYHNQLAWVYSTCRDTLCRNAEKALAHAMTASELTAWRDPIILDTLAAAYTASGDFEQAVQELERALALASESDRRALEVHLQMLRQRKPFHELPV